MRPAKQRIYFAGLITLFGIGGLGLILMISLQNKDISDILFHYPASIFLQIIIGLGYGAVTAGILLFLLKRKILRTARVFFKDIFTNFNLSYFDIIFISVNAGIGEELLFRGALQQWLGIWLTAIIFIALHGYLNPKDKPLFIYGILLFVVSAGFGYLMKYCGLWSAMSAHCIVDVILLLYLKPEKKII